MLLRTVAKKSNSALYFRGNFLDPTANGFTVGYTDASSVFWGGSFSNPYVAIGTEFLSTKSGGSSVNALNHGTVIHKGSSALLGNFVVIDHGCGLLTWYGHLSTVNVEDGDTVIKGAVIGQTGTSGIATDNGFLLVCTVYDTVIDPETILGKGFTVA